MDQPATYIVRFDKLNSADAGRAAESLRRSLQDVDPTIQARRVRSDPEAMDAGSALAVVLSAGAVVELARGIANWLARAPSSRLTVIRPDGRIIVENISARDAASLAEKLQKGDGER